MFGFHEELIKMNPQDIKVWYTVNSYVINKDINCRGKKY